MKQRNREALAAEIKAKTGVAPDPASLFDIQAKRFHEYKRQHLNVLHAVWLYDRIRRGLDDGTQRTVLFAGKAAPGYRMAKLIVRLIHGVAETIDWTQALVALGQTELDAGVVDDTLGSVVKDHEDLTRVREIGVGVLVAESSRG